MAKCAMCVFHEKDKHMENTWFLAYYNEEKTMRFPCVYPKWKMHVAQLAIILYKLLMVKALTEMQTIIK